jgi:succinoglycan biosynthesis protein ExoA
MKISVIVPCRNEKRHIGALLNSLLTQDLAPDWQVEILVADGMSDDGTRDLLRQYAARASNIRMIDNPGQIVSTGLNAAIGAATGEIVIRMDAHTTYARNYVRECVAVLQESGADNVGGPWVAEGNGLLGKAIAAAFHSRFCAGGAKAHDPSYAGEVDTVYLGCWSRSVFDKCGLFDPRLVRNQDDEFNLRLRRLGGRIWQSPRIKSTYSPRGSLTALFRQYVQYGFWKVAVIRKHRTVASWRHVVPVMFVSSILLWAALMALAGAFGISGIASLSVTALAVELLFYGLACVVSTLAFFRSLRLPVLLIMPGVMAVYHVAYGLGFLIAVLQPANDVRATSPRFLTALTR